MKYIANIVTKHKVDAIDFFNVTSDFSSVDTTLPTLIVGWKEVKELFPEQDILESDKDLIAFIEKAIKTIDTKVNYRFFNYILASQEKRNAFVSYLHKGGCSIYYNSRFLYIYNPKQQMTLGVSLQDLRYVGIKIPKFISLLNVLGNNIITDNINFLSQESLILIKDNIKAVPYLNYLKNFDIYRETVD